MLKYVNTGIVFQEIPDEVTLSINISNCPCHCSGCHSKYLWQDIGEPLTAETLDRFMERYSGEVSCVCFMGGDSEPQHVAALALYLRQEYPDVKVAWYSGRQQFPQGISKRCFDYIKVGPYIERLGALKQPTTNQRLYKHTADEEFKDITPRFWRA